MDGILESGAGRRAARILVTGAAVGAAVGLVIVIGILMATTPRARADKAYWTLSGPPCPTATQAEIDRIGRPLAQVNNFGGARFARSSGAVLCDAVTDGIGLIENAVCQFNSPRLLAVWSKGGTALYQFPWGQRATVTVSDDRPPRCVAAAHFDGD